MSHPQDFGPHYDDPGVFGWDPTGLISAEVRRLVETRLTGLPDGCAGTVTRLLQVSGDYRLVAEYLRAARAPDAPAVEACERIAQEADEVRRGRLRYELGRLRYAAPSTGPSILRDTHADVLDAWDKRVSGYVADPSLRDVFDTLLEELGSGLSAYVENQHEVPGPNARIRQGVVKTWFLPDGTQVASKRENPLKPDRFRREQLAYQEIVRRLGTAAGGSVALRSTPDGRQRALSVPPLLALLRDGANDRTYSVSRWVPSTPLESLLMSYPASLERATRLGDYRDLLDLLFDHGILWGDLSPRNVLLTRNAECDVFHIVDFEKTTVRDAPILYRDRVLHCRGQVGVEELGVLCSPDEVQTCLDGYFDPDSWDLISADPVPFPLRPEVAAVLLGRGVAEPTLGEYNSTDMEIFDVRSPDRHPLTGERRYPGLVNFRVEHYLSCAGRRDAGDYDRMTTEILIAARLHGCFEAALTIVTVAVDKVERRFAVGEFTDVLDGVTSTPAQEIRTLTARLAALDAARADPEHFRTTCVALAREVQS
jgi:hypothetical protein